MRRNLALARWRAGGRTIGGWLSLSNTHIAELMAHAGFDWLCIDLQHGLLDYADLRNMLPAIATTDTTPIVRVAGHDPAGIMKVLDAGAMGVIVPLVNSREEAATLRTGSGPTAPCGRRSMAVRATRPRPMARSPVSP